MRGCCCEGLVSGVRGCCCEGLLSGVRGECCGEGLLDQESVLAASGVREGVVVKVFCIRSKRSSASGGRGRLKVLCIRREGECFGKGLQA